MEILLILTFADHGGKFVALDYVKILQNLLTNKTRYATDPLLDALAINLDALAIKCGGKVEGKKSLTVRAKERILLDVRRGNRSTHRNRAQAQKGDA